MQKLLEELWKMYEKAVNVEYALGALKRSEEQSLDYVELQKEHVHEMVGALDLLRHFQSDFVNCLNDICVGLENELKED